MSEVSFWRHSGWFAPEYAPPLNIIGVGATGSNIGLIAAKMGFQKFRIWDPDVVENHNLPNQIYDIHHIGQHKTDAFKDVLVRFNPRIEVETYNELFTSTQEQVSKLEGPLVLTVDTMQARKEIYEAFKLNWKVECVFETRLGFDYGELNVIDNSSMEACNQWYKTLMNDEDIPDGPCNLRICTTLVTIVAAQTVHHLCDMAVTRQNGKNWNPPKKVMFQLDPKLTVYNI